MHSRLVSLHNLCQKHRVFSLTRCPFPARTWASHDGWAGHLPAKTRYAPSDLVRAAGHKIHPHHRSRSDRSRLEGTGFCGRSVKRRERVASGVQEGRHILLQSNLRRHVELSMEPEKPQNIIALSSRRSATGKGSTMIFVAVVGVKEWRRDSCLRSSRLEAANHCGSATCGWRKAVAGARLTTERSTAVQCYCWATMQSNGVVVELGVKNVGIFYPGNFGSIFNCGE